jgi:hypothetical protein
VWTNVAGVAALRQARRGGRVGGIDYERDRTVVTSSTAISAPKRPRSQQPIDSMAAQRRTTAATGPGAAVK